MSSGPTDNQLRDWARQLDRIHHELDPDTGQVIPRNLPRWRTLAEQVITHRDREATGTSRPDGYSTSTRPEPHGSDISRPTETTALARLRTDTHDSHHTQVQNAITALAQAVEATNRFLTAIGQLEGKPANLPAALCEACKRAGVQHPPDFYRCSHGGQLPTELALCSWAREYTSRQLTAWRKQHPTLSPTWRVILPDARRIAEHERSGGRVPTSTTR